MISQAVVKKSFSRTLATAISTIVHPIALPLLTIAVVTDVATGQLSQGLLFATLALVLTSVPVGGLVFWQVSRGHWSDLDVSVRRQRYLLYPVGIICAVLLVGVLYLVHAPAPAMVTVLTFTLANIVNGAINLSYKVSGHAMTAAACATLLWLYAPGWGLPFAVAAALVGWSRVTLGRHTPGQVALGWTVGVVSALAVHIFYPG
jgi:membrane-associated phospholipid phosphatase